MYTVELYVFDFGILCQKKSSHKLIFLADNDTFYLHFNDKNKVMEVVLQAVSKEARSTDNHMQYNIIYISAFPVVSYIFTFIYSLTLQYDLKHRL